MKIVHKAYRIVFIFSLASLMQHTLYNGIAKSWFIFPWKDVGKKDTSLALCVPYVACQQPCLEELWDQVYSNVFYQHFIGYNKKTFVQDYSKYCVVVDKPAYFYALDTYAEATGPRLVLSHPDYVNNRELQRQHSALSLFLFAKITTCILNKQSNGGCYFIFFIPDSDKNRVKFTTIPAKHSTHRPTHTFTWGRSTGEYLPLLFNWDAISQRYPTITSSFLSWQKRVTEWAYINPRSDCSGWEYKPSHLEGTLSYFLAHYQDTPQEKDLVRSLLQMRYQKFEEDIPDTHPLLPTIFSIIYEYYNPPIIQFPTERPLACKAKAYAWPCENPYHCEEQYFKYSAEGRSFQEWAPCPCIYCKDKDRSRYPEPAPLRIRWSIPIPSCIPMPSLTRLLLEKHTHLSTIKNLSLVRLVMGTLTSTTTIYVTWRIACHKITTSPS